MTERTLRYRVGNEHNPGDPFGRSELVIASDGSARLKHHFSRGGGAGGWTGAVDPAALAALWTALDVARFPSTPDVEFVGGDTARLLTVETGGAEESVALPWHATATIPGYAEVFDILDGVVRQLSGGGVRYPTKQDRIVRDVRPVRDE